MKNVIESKESSKETKRRRRSISLKKSFVCKTFSSTQSRPSPAVSVQTSFTESPVKSDQVRGCPLLVFKFEIERTTDKCAECSCTHLSPKCTNLKNEAAGPNSSPLLLLLFFFTTSTLLYLLLYFFFYVAFTTYLLLLRFFFTSCLYFSSSIKFLHYFFFFFIFFFFFKTSTLFFLLLYVFFYFASLFFFFSTYTSHLGLN